ncbi:MAG: DEAD/DEAH box helicase family protein, partial [Gammaproteobacteria bacterium]|nr:DEAD/DEAH box helicase family protein [Gammaproteobacteria bacterium]
MTRNAACVVRIAVGVPLRKAFDFSVPTPAPAPGTRVLVPFRHRRLVGIVVGPADGSRPPATRIKPIIRILDPDPVFDSALFETLRWAAAYYHHPLGEVLLAALPPRLRVDHAQAPHPNPRFRLSALGRAGDLDGLRRAPLQRAIVERLRGDAGRAYAAHELAPISRSWKTAVAALQDKGWIDATSAYASSPDPERAGAPPLTPHQRAATDVIIEHLARYRCFLLHGVTGSGKTEVYLHVVAACLARQQQALVMVPEIALTPQLVGRFRDRFGNPVAVLHSGLAAVER